MKQILCSLVFSLSLAVPAGASGFGLDSTRAADIRTTRTPAMPAARPSRDVKDWTIIYYATTKDALKYSFISQLLDLKMLGSSGKVNIAVEGTFPVEDASGAVSTHTVRMAIGAPLDQAAAQQYAKTAILKDKQINADFLKAFSGDIVSDSHVADTGDWQRVAAFAQWAKANYPARRYVFLIYGHGNGIFDPKKAASANKGTLIDVETKNYVTLPEMHDMMSAVGHVDAFVMTSCIMQMAEVAWQVKDYTDVVVGSSELMWSAGYDMETLMNTLNGSASISSKDLGATLAKSYVDQCQQAKLAGAHASVINTAALPEFGARLSAWADAIKASGDKTAINTAIPSVARFDIFGVTLATSAAVASRVSISGDLYDFASLVTAAEPQGSAAAQRGQELMDYISNSLVYKYYSFGTSATGYDYLREHGVSIFIPPVKMIGGSPAGLGQYEQTNYWDLPFASDTTWGSFLKWDFGMQ